MSNALITVDLLADHGLTVADVRRQCPWATKYTGFDGTPCWLRADLAPLLREPEGDS